MLAQIGKDIRSELVANEIEEPFEISRSRNREYAVGLITNECNSITNNREKAKSYRGAFERLLAYFRREPVEANRLFPEIIKRAHHLLDDEVIMDSLNKAQQFSSIMTEFGVKDATELRELLSRHDENSNDTLNSMSIEELLISLGIASSDDLEKALKDNDLATHFAHRPKPTKMMFDLARHLIDEAKDKVIAHLRTLHGYNLDDMQETAPTVLAGIRKDGQRIYITIRPAKGGYVVIYYGSELDVLDFVTSELWIYDGVTVRRISLGHILKTSGIRKLPV